jgi:hypothetical protein
MEGSRNPVSVHGTMRIVQIAHDITGRKRVDRDAQHRTWPLLARLGPEPGKTPNQPRTAARHGRPG